MCERERDAERVDSAVKRFHGSTPIASVQCAWDSGPSLYAFIHLVKRLHSVIINAYISQWESKGRQENVHLY